MGDEHKAAKLRQQRDRAWQAIHGVVLMSRASIEDNTYSDVVAAAIAPEDLREYTEFTTNKTRC